MLPEIVADALQFLSRRDLDKACGVSKWLDALIAQCCEEYPLRPLALVNLYPRGSGYELDVRIEDGTDSHHYHPFTSMDDAARFTGSMVRHSYVERFWLGASYFGIMTIRPDQWSKLIEAIRRSNIQRFQFERVDFSALNDDAFLVALGCRGLQSFDVHDSVVPSGFVTDDLLRACLTKGLCRLRLSDNDNDAPHRLSEDVVLDVCFPAHAAPGGLPRNVQLEGTGVTDTFLKKFIERARTSPSRPSGSLKFYDAAKQRHLSAYAEFLAPAPLPWMEHTYRLLSVDGGNESYEVTFRERSSYMVVKFRPVHY